jgi:hypothetical protein
MNEFVTGSPCDESPSVKNPELQDFDSESSGMFPCGCTENPEFVSPPVTRCATDETNPFTEKLEFPSLLILSYKVRINGIKIYQVL